MVNVSRDLLFLKFTFVLSYNLHTPILNVQRSEFARMYVFVTTVHIKV